MVRAWDKSDRARRDFRAALLIVAGVGLSLGLGGCAYNHRLRCEQWQAQGDFFGTTESCLKCIDALGTTNKQAVSGCALGLDAADLLGGRRQYLPPSKPANHFD
jgi:hypothetical protein